MIQYMDGASGAAEIGEAIMHMRRKYRKFCAMVSRVGGKPGAFRDWYQMEMKSRIAISANIPRREMWK